MRGLRIGALSLSCYLSQFSIYFFFFSSIAYTINSLFFNTYFTTVIIGNFKIYYDNCKFNKLQKSSNYIRFLDSISFAKLHKLYNFWKCHNFVYYSIYLFCNFYIYYLCNFIEFFYSVRGSVGVVFRAMIRAISSFTFVLIRVGSVVNRSVVISHLV